MKNRFFIPNIFKVTGKTLKKLGIKTTISIENIKIAIPHSNEFSHITIPDPTAMNNFFNSYDTSIAKKTKSNIKF